MCVSVVRKVEEGEWKRMENLLLAFWSHPILGTTETCRQKYFDASLVRILILFFLTTSRRDVIRNILQSDEIKKIEIKFQYVRLWSWSNAFVMTALQRKKSFGSLVKMLMEDETFIYLFSTIQMMGQWQSVFLICQRFR